MLDVLYTIIIVIEVFLQPQFILVVIVQVGLVENAQHLVQAIVDLPNGGQLELNVLEITR